MTKDKTIPQPLRGIMLVATGHPYYGNMAYNLAISIKSVEDISIAVVFTGASLSHLSASQVAIFDHKIEAPDDYRTGFGVKLHLDQLTPYDQTLCLDVDMLWLSRKPSDLFDELNGKQFRKASVCMYPHIFFLLSGIIAVIMFTLIGEISFQFRRCKFSFCHCVRF